jgi:hypothetical protein
LRPCIRRDSHPTLTRPRLGHDPHSQQRLRRFLHDPKSLTPAPTQKRNVNIRRVSRENIRRMTGDERLERYRLNAEKCLALAQTFNDNERRRILIGNGQCVA